MESRALFSDSSKRNCITWMACLWGTSLNNWCLRRHSLCTEYLEPVLSANFSIHMTDFSFSLVQQCHVSHLLNRCVFSHMVQPVFSHPLSSLNLPIKLTSLTSLFVKLKQFNMQAKILLLAAAMMVVSGEDTCITTDEFQASLMGKQSVSWGKSKSSTMLWVRTVLARGNEPGATNQRIQFWFVSPGTV